MRSLKDISSAAVVDSMDREEDVDKLEVPVTLNSNLVKAFRNDWSPRYYRDNINRQSRNGSPSEVRKDVYGI